MQNINTSSNYKSDSEKLETTSEKNSTTVSDKSLTETPKFNFYTLNDNDIQEIKNLCIQNVPFWDNLNHDDIEVEIITYAVTNLVFTATLKCADKTQYPYAKLILKKESSHNTLLYDTDLQYQVSKLLGDNNCGPKVIGRFGDYTIQEWIEGETTTNYSFKNISVVTSLASSLAKFHKKGTELAPKEWDRTPFVLKRMELWSQHVNNIIKKYNLDLDYNELENYFDIYKRVMNNHIKNNNSIANSVMFCHNDIFTLNILDFQHGIYLIDFDYSGFNYVGWEIANFFAKAHTIYNITDHPYFIVDDSIRFTNERSSIFVSAYLSQLLDKNILPTDILVKEFLDSLEVHMLGVHLFWIFWRLIMFEKPVHELTIPLSFIDHCKLHYNQFKEYLEKLTDNNMIQY